MTFKHFQYKRFVNDPSKERQQWLEFADMFGFTLEGSLEDLNADMSDEHSFISVSGSFRRAIMEKLKDAQKEK